MIRLIALVASALIGLLGFRTGLFDPMLDWIKHFVLTDIPDFIWPLLPSGLASMIKDFQVSEVASIISDAGWFIPFWGILGIYFIAFSMAGFILFLRYIVGWIPTIEG